MERPNRWVIPAVALVTALSLPLPASGGGPQTELVSKESNGTAAMAGDSEDPAISDNGRFIAFESQADNLSLTDDNDFDNIFVHNRQTGVTTLVSVKSNGDAADDNSENPSISRNGRYVTFQSQADNLNPNVDTAFNNVFVHDRQTGTTRLVSKKSNGTPAVGGFSENGSISNSGRLVTFESDANNLSAKAIDTFANIFVHDRETKKTELVSVRSNGDPADDGSFDPLISGNGRVVAFESQADNFPGEDGFRNIYVRDLERKKTHLVTKASNGDWADDDSEDQVLSCDGRLVAYASSANNLSNNEDEGFQNVFVHNRKTGKTKLVSKTSDGDGAVGGSSRDPDISCGGRYVAIQSDANNLSTVDDDLLSNIFVHDRETGTTELVSRMSDGGTAANGNSDLPEPNAGTISADGAFITFRSEADNLNLTDDNLVQNVFVRGPLA